MNVQPAPGLLVELEQLRMALEQIQELTGHMPDTRAVAIARIAREALKGVEE
jgi:hypothetical protein